ncbi:MAG TPA: HlyD family efflux transporter periplasmic adaptor subunit [Acetivibrio sp.]|nr:HlyD family efflux transporter periplasmic adaptor subunit [Acetivibrio sp.]
MKDLEEINERKKSESETNDRRKGESGITGRIKLGGIIILLFLLLYIPSFVFWVYSKNISVDILRMGEIEESIPVDALIVRNETVVNSPADGIIIKDIEEGEKIRAGSTIATILNKSSEKLLDDLKALDLRIIEAQREKAKNDGFFVEDIKNIDGQIEDKLMIVMAQASSNSISEVKNIKKDIDGLIQKKATITGDLSISDAHINSLKAQKQVLQESINQNKSNIVSDIPGIISYVVDGCESFLNQNAISSLTSKDIKSIKPQNPVKKMDDLGVEFNKPVVKVISGIDYYIVFAVDKKEAEGFKVEDSWNLRINDINRTIDGTVMYKSDETDGKVVIAVRTDKAMSDTAALRNINVDLIKNRYSGLVVPLKCLIDIDMTKMTAKIGLVRAQRAEFVPVKIVGINNEFAIIDNVDSSYYTGDNSSRTTISLYSSYIVNPKNIEEGQIVN